MTKITIIKRSLFLSSVCILMACGAPKKLIQLEDARAFYELVSRDPMVQRNAALELEDAHKSLKKANKHWQKGADKSVVEHYAYMTDQQLAIAQYRAKLIENEDRLIAMTLEYQRVQLAVNEQEAVDSKNVAMIQSRETQDMITRALALKQHVRELQAQQTDRGLVLTLGHKLFDGNSASLRQATVTEVGKVAGFMNEYPDQSVLIEGHTDANGDDSYNQELSARRAESVKLALVLKGVAAQRLVTRGLGESSPRVANTESLANLRVEIIFEKDRGVQASQYYSFQQPH